MPFELEKQEQANALAALKAKYKISAATKIRATALENAMYVQAHETDEGEGLDMDAVLKNAARMEGYLLYGTDDS